ncbi:thiol-disulfide oxidoreductase DCC family protein [Polycyclovorans algicola]|uniref:thiol-disulfide oxidoreductase DCC family protein n=1 Tax=Polycyclovorans algicola TaxID=616992 RepID=UPI0004A73393|nr:DCC1-like thiol-disulfide oxidoreductase family protein [Polycyclovorans algicola]
MSETPDAAVLLFDGDCAFCNGCVRWLLRHERRPRYQFAALQSDAAQPLLARFEVPPGDLGSVLVIDHGRLYRKTAAVLHLLPELRWPWPLLRVFVLVPRVLRDAVYDFVGARRYRWWGRATSCVIADPAWHSRVLTLPSSVS